MSSLIASKDQKEEMETWFTKERTIIETGIKRPLSFEEMDTLKKFAEIVILYEFETSYFDWLEDLN